MPEGDTVWRTARALDRALRQARIIRSDFRVPQLAETDLAGLPVNGTRAHGKHLLTRLGDDLTLHTHLKMEGAWHLYRPETRWQRPSHEVRVLLETPRWRAVGFALGVVELIPREDERTALAHLGPDLLGPDWEPAEAVRRLLAAPDRGIAEALLDQRNLAGLGNLYVAELCFLQGLDPHRPVREVADPYRLVSRAKGLLEANKERVEQTTTGRLGRGRQHWVYGREGSECLRCGTAVVSGTIGEPGRERTTYWCPSCQP